MKKIFYLSVLFFNSCFSQNDSSIIGKYVSFDTTISTTHRGEELKLNENGTFDYILYQFHNLSVSKGFWFKRNDSLILNSDISLPENSLTIKSEKQPKLLGVFNSRKYKFIVGTNNSGKIRYSIYVHNSIDTILKRNCIGTAKIRIPKKYNSYYIIALLGSKYPDEMLPETGSRIMISIPLRRIFKNEIWRIEKSGIRPLTNEGRKADYVLWFQK